MSVLPASDIRFRFAALVTLSSCLALFLSFYLHDTASGLPPVVFLHIGLVSIGAVLPWLSRCLYLSCYGLAFLAIRWISELKVALVGMPLTWTDIEVFAFRPRASISALQMPGWVNTAVVGVAALVLACVAALFLYDLVRSDNFAARLAVILAAICLCVASDRQVTSCVDGLFRAHGRRIFNPPEHVALARLGIGYLGYIAYSHGLAAGRRSPFFEEPDATPPPAEAVRQAAARLVRPAAPTMAPNIVVFLAESTFDPNDAFVLKRPFHSYLFERNPSTHVEGPLEVNVVGGGTWTSEFEFFTGLDSRLFGYAGAYAPVMLSTFVRRSLVHHLAERGYSTSAYYATNGDFMEARRSFQRYGFQRDMDGPDLGFPANQWRTKDKEIVEQVLKDVDARSDEPFFKYIQLLENHSPHLCAEDSPHADPEPFAASATRGQSCQMSTYLRTVHATGEAVRSVVARLAEIEARTGRGFVVLVFGDHQPHTFTRTGMGPESTEIYDEHRRHADNRRTFYHVMSSLENPLGPALTHASAPPPLTLLPTVLSAYAAASPDDLYLPLNALAYDRCGTELPLQGDHASQAPAGCALRPLIAGYRNSGVMTFD